MNITEIVIENLFGNDYVIPIKDNIIVITGVNGTCKTIILNIVKDILRGEQNYYSEHFDNVYITIDDINYEIKNGYKRHELSGLIKEEKGTLLYPRNYPKLNVEYIYGDLFSLHDKAISPDAIPVINSYLSDSGKDITKLSDLKILSHGEGKIVDVLNYFYTIKEPVILIFDEPEATLCMDWQQRFLSDIIATGKCNFLMIATHSPEILSSFPNDYWVNVKTLIKPKEV